MEEAIHYTIKESRRARLLRITVNYDGSVVVTSPLGTKPATIEKFVAKKKRWITKNVRFFNNANSQTTRPLLPGDYHIYKDAVLVLIEERIQFYNNIFYGFSFNKIYVKNQKTVWGSCTRKRNLNFNYKIFFLPERMRDYIIVHELCHLQAFNHSPKFWELVERALPDYQELESTLKKCELAYW